MATDVLYGLVFPIVGTILAWILSAAPIPHLIKAEPTGKLGHFSPYPSIVFLATASTWFMYGCQRGLTFVILANGVCILILLYVVLRCHRLADEALRVRMEGLTFALLTLDLAFVLALTSIRGDTTLMETIIGSTAVAFNTIMFIVPLSSMAAILKHRDSSPIFLPWAAASTVCSLCWTLYGIFGVKDMLVAGPNIVGLALGILQLFLRAIFPAKATVAAAVEDAANAEGIAAAVDGSVAGKDVSTSAGATGAGGGGTATANPLAAARKLSASKHLLVRNDSYNEMRQQQQAEMAKQLSALPEAGPVAAPPAVTPAAPVLSTVKSDKEQADASASGARMAAAS